MLYRVNHVHIKSKDPKETADWYVKAFNFNIVSDTVRAVGDRFIRCQTPDGVVVNISGARTDEQMGDGDAVPHWGLEHFAMNVDDLDAEIQRLKELGAELLELRYLIQLLGGVDLEALVTHRIGIKLGRRG